MVFTHSLKTDEMALYVLENFEWDRREVVVTPLPLLYDYKDLCPDFNLAAAEEASRDLFLLEISQVVFCAMLLNDAVKLGVLRGGMIEIMELALVELRWSTFKECVWCNRATSYKPTGQRQTVIRKRVRGLAMRSPPGDDGNEVRNKFSRERVSTLFCNMVFSGFLSTEQAVDYIRETFKWHLRGSRALLDRFPRTIMIFACTLTLPWLKKLSGIPAFPR
ncbi:hypothetical protein Cgig2_025682 [Carnegiea gigantea]|uniref:Uncharacterized protein n=1 Tax=Carnegiea gigantea TaxID=171969 RepID=A0A9Q1JTY2_9CARY|nr:hypothetical protein Cgig2_025682 [Carnegiea gigantea]